MVIGARPKVKSSTVSIFSREAAYGWLPGSSSGHVYLKEDASSRDKGTCFNINSFRNIPDLEPSDDDDLPLNGNYI